MILVTVGMHTQGFPRLIRKMDEVAKGAAEEVIMQTGCTNYVPLNAHYFRFASQEEMDRLSQAARIIITHAGAGSIITALNCSKPLIVVPRLKKYSECIDDHQLELAEALSREGRATMICEIEKIDEALRQEKTPKSTNIKRERLILALQRYLAKLEVFLREGLRK